MLKKTLIGTASALIASCGVSVAADTPINGSVQSRCIIQTDTSGTYANPNAYTLTTLKLQHLASSQLHPIFQMLYHGQVIQKLMLYQMQLEWLIMKQTKSNLE